MLVLVTGATGFVGSHLVEYLAQHTDWRIIGISRSLRHVSNLAADYLGYQYWISRELPAIRIRPFNQIGPRQSPEFALPAFARQIAEIEDGHSEPILRTGNLTPVRDFMDVRDAAAAYRLALEN